MIGVNEHGLRVGQWHPNAVLTDGDVDRMLELREGGWTYERLARTFEVSKSTVAMIARGDRRAQRAVRWRSEPRRERPRPVRSSGCSTWVRPPIQLHLFPRAVDSLSDQERRRIVRQWIAGASFHALALMYGLTAYAVERIVHVATSRVR